MELKELTLQPGEQIIIIKTSHIAAIIKRVPSGLEIHGPLNDRGETYHLSGTGFTPRNPEQSRSHRRRLKQDLNVLFLGVFLGALGVYALIS